MRCPHPAPEPMPCGRGRTTGTFAPVVTPPRRGSVVAVSLTQP
jgi:hypothetical protein